MRQNRQAHFQFFSCSISKEGAASSRDSIIAPASPHPVAVRSGRAGLRNGEPTMRGALW
jgi:hypothetical protein